MMTREHHRRRSPESTRRRRRERRDSREQLQSHAVPTSMKLYEEPFPEPYQQPYQHSYQQSYQLSYQQPYQPPHQQSYQEQYPPQDSPAHDHGRDRDRGLSSPLSTSSTSSSTSSSLLNISRPDKKFGLGVFFSGDGRKHRRRVRKKRSKFLRFGNSSSSSVGSDLAYGRGYIDRRRSREFSPPSGQRPPRRDGDSGKPPAQKRAQTDEEIIELGRKFAEIARQQNAEDLRAAGRKRPSTLTGAVNALDKFRRSNSGNLNKGIGNSKPQRDSSSDDSDWEDWESASSEDESGEDSSDNGLAYGSSHHLPSSSERPSHLAASSDPAQMYPQGIPLNRKRSLVDPKLFGPINSLRGFVHTPCGFERVDRNTVSDARSFYEPSIAPGEMVVSAEGRPLQHVYPVPTSDPSRFDAGRGSIVSAHRDSTPRSRPEPVPIQQPKPITPVHSKVFDSVDSSPDSSKRPLKTRAIASTAGSGMSAIWSSDAAIGAILRAARNGDQNKHREARAGDAKSKSQRASDEEYDSTLSSDAAIGALLRAARKGEQNKHQEARDILPDTSSEKPREQEPEATRDDEKATRFREKREPELDRGSENTSRHRDKYRDHVDNASKSERNGNDLRHDQKVSRRESRREEGRADKSIAYGPKNDIPAPSKGPSIERSKGPVDPFQYQVADDAFPTPRYGTPTEPLPPVIMTIEREPDFSKLETYEPYERLSRKDSFEREQRETQKAREAAAQAAVPVGKTNFAAAAAAAAAVAAAGIAKRQRERSSKRDPSSQNQSPISSSSSRPKDPVIDDADRAYREERLARRIREQEERSRSSSPDRSIVDKWKDEKESATTPQTASPLPVDDPKPKNPYDGPNADVRIDNVLEHPKELSRFRISESRRQSSTFPIFSARDPSAERERPMLNLVRPTPAPSPGPGKRRLEEMKVSPPTTEIETDPLPTGTRDEVVSNVSTSPSKAVSWGENETKHYVVQTPEREDDPYSGTKIITPSVTPRSRTSKKNSWAAIAAAMSGVGVGVAASSVSDSVVHADATREHVEIEDPTRPFGRESSLQFDELYDDPPVPGPKPSSPRSPRTHKRFAEDPEFMANIAAGLEGSGFDPNIIIDDDNFHRRDSPPGSNVPFGSSTTTATGTWDERPDTASKEKEISPDTSEIFSRLSKKEIRQHEKVPKQHISHRSASTVHNNSPPETPRSISEEDWAVPTRKLRQKEQKRGDMIVKSEAREDDQVPGNSSSVQRRPSPVNEDWEDMSEKKKPKKLKRAIVIQQEPSQDIQRDPLSTGYVEPSEPITLVELSRDFEDAKTIESVADQASEQTPRIQDRNLNLGSPSQDSQRIIDDSAVALPEQSTAPSLDKKKKKKKAKRESVTEDSPPSTIPALELLHESSYDYVEPEVNPLLGDGRYSPKKSEKTKGNVTDVDSLPRSLDISKSTEDAGDEASEPINEYSVADDWNLPTGRNEKPQRDPLSSRRPTLIEDIVESPQNIIDSATDIRSVKSAVTEEEWEDLPRKSRKKKKTRRDTIKHEGSPSHSASKSASFSEISVEGTKMPKEAPRFDSPPRPAPTYGMGLEYEEMMEKKETSRSAPSEFIDETGFVAEGELNRERGVTESKDNRGSGTSYFFDRFKSTFGFSDEKEQSDTQDRDENSFLDNAGALGASAGSTGAAIALAHQNPPENATDTAPKTDSPRETKTIDRYPSPPPEIELIDPEIFEREIRPAIDPTYGDLLPLPPSRPSTPVPTLDEDIPPLPESRPGTPEDNRERRLLTEKSTHVRRRSDTPLRVKTPSHSAIPIQFRLGQRTTPVSPGILKQKQSPSSSPVAATTPETSSAPKPRARPMSWESTRAFKPLLLVEKTSRGLGVTPTPPEEEMQPINIPGSVHEEPQSRPSYTSTPLDDLHNDHTTRETTAQPSDSPQLPPLRSVDEPESPTPRPNPVDPVSKNRSSYLLYSSPPSVENSKDVYTPESSPTLRAAKRQATVSELKEGVPDLTGSDLSGGGAAGPVADTLVASAIIVDHVDSQEVSLGAKDGVALGAAPLGESTELSEAIVTDEKRAKEIDLQEVARVSGKKSKKGKKGKNKSRDFEPLAEVSRVEAPGDPEISLTSDPPEPVIETDGKEDDPAPDELSKKDKKAQSQSLAVEHSIAAAAEIPLPGEDQEDEFFDIPVEQVAVEPAAKEVESNALADAHIETPTKVPEVTLVAPVETTVEVISEPPIDPFAEAPVDASVEEARIGAPVEMPADAPVEAPIETVTQIPVEPSIEAPADGSITAPVELPETLSEAPVETAAKDPVNSSIDATAEGVTEAITEAPVEAGFVEDLALVEPVTTSKKGKKKKRKSQITEPEAEEQPSLTMPQGQGLEETVTDEMAAAVEDPILADEKTPLEEEASVSSVAFENPSIVSKKGKKKRGKKSFLAEEEPIIAPAPEPATPAETVSPDRDQERTDPFRTETPEHGSGHVQVTPVDVEHVPLSPEEGTSEDALLQVSPTANKGLSITTSNKSKKDKKGENSETAELETSGTADNRTDTETAKEVQQSEAEPSSKAPDETNSAIEAISTGRNPTASTESLLKTPAEVVEPGLGASSDEANEKSQLASETLQPPDDMAEPTIAELEPAQEGNKVDTHESEGDVPTQAGEPSSVPSEDQAVDRSQSSALNEQTESETRQELQTTDVTEDPLSENVVQDSHAPALQSPDTAEPSTNALVDTVGEAQTTPPDQITGDEPRKDVDLPDEPQGKKKGKKKKKKQQSVSDLSDIRETAGIVRQTEDLPEQTARDLPLTEQSEQTVEISPSVGDRITEPGPAEPLTEDIRPDNMSSGKKSKKGKKGKKTAVEPDTPATEEVAVSPEPEEEVALENQGVVDSERLVPAPQAEPSANDSHVESAALEGTGTETIQSADLSTLKDANQLRVEAEPSVADDTTETPEQEFESNRLPATETEIPAERQITEAEPEIEVISSKKRSKKDKKKRGSTLLDSGIDVKSDATDSPSLHQDANTAPPLEPSDPADLSIEPATDSTGPNTAQVISRIENLSPSGESENRKQQDPVLARDEDASSLPDPGSETVSEVKEVPAVLEHVKEDDADTSISPTSTKKSKKNKKKKRQSVQFAESMEESTEIPAESTVGIIVPDLTTEPEDVPPDTSTTLADPASLPSDVSRNLEQGRDEHMLPDSMDSRSVDFDPSSVPLPADEELEAYMPKGVSSHSVLPRAQSEDDHILEQEKDRETANADEMIDPPSQDGVDISIDTQPHANTDPQEPLANQTEVIGSDMASDAPVKPDDSVSTDQKAPAGSMPVAGHSIPTPAKDQFSVAEKSDEDKKHEGKSQENQKSGLDSPTLAVSLDKDVPTREYQETTPPSLPKEADPAQDESATPAEQAAEQPAVENVALHDIVPEVPTKKSKNGSQVPEAESTLSLDASPSSTMDDEAQGQENEVNIPQPGSEENTTGTFEAPDISKPPTDDQGSPPQERLITSPSIPNDHSQLSRDVQIGEPAILQPENPTTSVAKLVTGDTGTGELAPSLGPEPDQSPKTQVSKEQPPKEQPSDPVVSKPKGEKKKKRGWLSQLLGIGEPDTTENEGTEPASDVQTPPAVVEQASTDSLRETTDDQSISIPAQNAGGHPQDTYAHPELDPISIAPATPVKMERSPDPHETTEPPSAQLSFDDKVTLENAELNLSKKRKKDKEKKQESSWDNGSALLEPGESAEIPAGVQTGEATDTSGTIPPDESKDGDTAGSASAITTGEVKMEERLGGVQDEASFEPPAEAASEPTPEPAQLSSDASDQHDASLSTELDSSRADAPPKSQDILQGKETAHVDDTSSSTLKECEAGKMEENPVDLLDKEAALEPQLEPAQASPDNSVQNDTGLPTELKSSPTEDVPEAEDAKNIPVSTPTKKSKKDRKKKKKAASREEEAGPVSGETEKSEGPITVPAEVYEDKDTESYGVPDNAVSVQDKTIPQDDDTANTEDAVLHETVPKFESEPGDGNAIQTEAVPLDDDAPHDDSVPQEGGSKEETALQSEPASDSPLLDNLAPTGSEENKEEKPAGSWEDELLQDFTEGSNDATAVLAEPTEKEIPVQEPAGGESVTDTASIKKGTKDKTKEKQSGPLIEESPKEKLSEDIPSTASDLGQTTRDQIQTPTLELANDDDLAAPSQTKKGKKDKKKRKSVSQDDGVLKEQLATDSVAAAAGDMTSPVVNELLASEPPASEPSNDNDFAQPISRKRSKKDKKKKQIGLSTDDVPQDTFLEGDAPKADPPQEQLLQEGSIQEDVSKEGLSSEAAPKEEFPKEELPKEELPLEESLNEGPPREELALENISGHASDSLDSGMPEQVIQLQLETEATSEPTTILDSEKLQSDEITKIDVPANNDLPDSTPAKSKKDKKKKKRSSTLESDITPQEEPKQVEESQLPSAAETAPEVELPPEAEASETIPPADMKLEGIADPAPTKKNKKDKKKKKQELLEADLAQEPVEASMDPIPPGAPDPSEQAKVEVSLPDVTREMETAELSPTKGKTDEKTETPISREDEVSSQLQPSQEPDISKDMPAEPSQSEGVLESPSSKKSKKNKKKKRVSEVGPQPGVEIATNPESIAGPVEAVEPTEINASGLQGEQTTIHVTEDQGSGSQKPKAPSQDEAEKPPDNLDDTTQSAEPTSTEETDPATKPDSALESNIESKISETPLNAVPEGTTQELSSNNEQATPEAAKDEPLEEPVLEGGSEVGTGSLTPLREPETAEPETRQPEETAPKVDDGKTTEISKKSKKDKKKKKRASQVSWESRPEAEIEDLLEKQRSEQAFDKSMTSEPTELGNSGEGVEYPFSEFASGKKSEDLGKRQSQIEGEPEPDSAKTVEKPMPITPTEQGKRYDMLLDHQSLAEDTETSLKESTDLNDTFLETTSNKKSKKKASQLDREAEPGTAVASESATDPLPVEQNLTDKPTEPVDTLLIETTKTPPGKEAYADNVSPEIVSPKQSKKDKRRAKKHSTTETPKPKTSTGQPAENDPTTDDGTVSQMEPGATRDLTPVEDTSGIVRRPSSNLPAEEINTPLDQAQDAKESGQVQPIVHDTDASDAVMGTGPLHAESPDGGDSTALPGQLEEPLDEVSLKGQTEAQKDMITDTSQDLSEEPPESSTITSEKEKKAANETQGPKVSDADSNVKSGTNLQSWAWDWSNIDNATQPEIPAPKAVTVPEDSQVEPSEMVEPSDSTQTTSQQQQKEPRNDNVDSREPAPGKLEPQTQLEPEFPIARKKSEKEKMRKVVSQSESKTVSGVQTPQTQDDQLPVSKSRPQTPPPNRRALAAVDLSPAQLSSHIEHDRPFDQSTQPDKKLRTHHIEDDTMVPEPLPAMTTEPPARLPPKSETQVTDTVTGDGDFWTGPTVEAKRQSDEAARGMTGPAASQEVPEPTRHHDLGSDDANIESPVRGRGMVPEPPIHRPSDVEDTSSHIKEISTVGRQDSWDDLDTSEPLEDHDTPLRAGARDAPETSLRPSLPPPRTPSALDYSRSLPPVEEETHEDLEKELRSDLEGTGLEVNRDSGLVTDSPNRRGHGLGHKDNAGQRDSGVHMILGPSEETANSQEGSTRTAPSPPGESTSSQTPQALERHSRRSLFDNETPKLSTPIQGRAWDRASTPEKPAEDEPVKRATTPLKPTGAALHSRTPQPQPQPQKQTPRSVSDSVSVGMGSDTKRGTTPQPESAGRRSVSNTSISRLRTPDPVRYQPDSPGSPSIRSVHSIRSLRSAGANTPPLRSRRISSDLRSLSHSSHRSSPVPSLPISTGDRDRDRDRDRDNSDVSISDRHAHGLHHNITPIANEGRVRAKDMTDVYVSRSRMLLL
ncbi:hypothetical protein F4859DRAFT_363036 [Xylaria cf. heliscus]|nr:hypothetical protein F4859DRAFT_363036 [Xylaria cf. heliscus]